MFKMDRILTYILLLPVVEVQPSLTVPWNLTVYTTKQSWNEGYELCRNNNQTLLSIRNEKKYQALGTILPIWRANAYLNDDYWIGLFDKDPPEGNYTWSDCTSKGDWELWDTGEPDERDTSLCVRVYQYSGKWRTFFCDDYYQIICEQNIDSCWFEIFEGYILQGTLKSYGMPGPAECEERCSTKVDGEKECVGFSFGFGLCRMLLEEFVYVGSDPPVTANTNYDTYVKRCYEYHTQTEIGNLTINKERIPEHTCDLPSSTTDLVTSRVTTVSSSTVIGEVSSELFQSTYSSTFDFSDLTTINENYQSFGMFLSTSYDSGSTSVVDIPETIESSFSQSSTDLEYSTSTLVFTPLYPSSSSSSSSPSSQSTNSIITEPLKQTSVYNARVFCPCKCFTEVEVATVEAEIIEEIKKELVINTTSLSSFKRKLSSAEDNRSSAVLVGSIGIGFLVAIVLFFAILDVNHMLRGLRKILEHYRANRINIVYGSK